MNSDDLLAVVDAIYRVYQSLERQNDRLDDLIQAIQDLKHCFSTPNYLSLDRDTLTAILAGEIMSALIRRNLPLDGVFLAETAIRMADYLVTRSFSYCSPTNEIKEG